MAMEKEILEVVSDKNTEEVWALTFFTFSIFLLILSPIIKEFLHAYILKKKEDKKEDKNSHIKDHFDDLKKHIDGHIGNVNELIAEIYENSKKLLKDFEYVRENTENRLDNLYETLKDINNIITGINLSSGKNTGNFEKLTAISEKLIMLDKDIQLIKEKVKNLEGITTKEGEILSDIKLLIEKLENLKHYINNSHKSYGGM